MKCMCMEQMVHLHSDSILWFCVFIETRTSCPSHFGQTSVNLSSVILSKDWFIACLHVMFFPRLLISFCNALSETNGNKASPCFLFSSLIKKDCRFRARSCLSFLYRIAIFKKEFHRRMGNHLLSQTQWFLQSFSAIYQCADYRLNAD